MNVDISKEEYRDLLDLLYIAHWVLHSHAAEADQRTASYERLIQKFNGLARAMGFAGLVEYSPETKSYQPSASFEESTRSWEFIDEFTDDTFWDELVHRLAERDASRIVGGFERLDSMKSEDRLSLETPLMDRYTKEFDERGLERLEIVEHFGPGIANPVKTSD